MEGSHGLNVFVFVIGETLGLPKNMYGSASTLDGTMDALVLANNAVCRLAVNKDL